MKRFAIVPLITTCLISVPAFSQNAVSSDRWAEVQPAVYHPSGDQAVRLTPIAETTRRHRRMSKRKKDSVKRIGGGAAGGAVIGALVGGGKGAAIGAAAGGGAGAVYDHHKKSKGQ